MEWHQFCACKAVQSGQAAQPAGQFPLSSALFFQAASLIGINWCHSMQLKQYQDVANRLFLKGVGTDKANHRNRREFFAVKDSGKKNNSVITI